MDVDELKHKLRELKRVEDRLRFGYYCNTAAKKYVWEDYFSTKSVNDLMVKYPLWKLSKLDKQALKEVFEEYFYSVYFQKYKDEGLSFDEIQDPSVLSYFGLTPGASIDEIKSRFRELAKKYHPDLGGSSEKMIEILEAYHKLMDKV
ncbi:MAG: hypothetical protein K0R84_2041 [Clostridia bacterium]|jgi:hypothetical protein|nr:hypothetical protein [Clostridia bacterium]